MEPAWATRWLMSSRTAVHISRTAQLTGFATQVLHISLSWGQASTKSWPSPNTRQGVLADTAMALLRMGDLENKSIPLDKSASRGGGILARARAGGGDGGSVS